MIDKRHYWSGLKRLKRKIVTAWLVIAIAPAIPLLAVLVLKMWELASPVILAAFALLGLVAMRCVVTNQSWRWR